MAELIRNVELSKDFKLTDLVELEPGKVNSISAASFTRATPRARSAGERR